MVAHVSDVEVDHFYAAVGGRVRNTRSGRGISQSTLARQIGFTRSSVANLEAGRQRVSLHLFIQIADALGVEPSALLPREGLPTRRSDMLDDLGEHLVDVPETTQEFVRGAIAQLMPDTQG